MSCVGTSGVGGLFGGPDSSGGSQNRGGGWERLAGTTVDPTSGVVVLDREFTRRSEAEGRTRSPRTQDTGRGGQGRQEQRNREGVAKERKEV